MIALFANPRTRAASAVLVLILAGLTVGCGRGIGNIKGTVSFQGKPLPAGTISFYDSDNGVQNGEIKSDGSYEVKGVLAGEAKIAVRVPLIIDSPIKVGPAPTIVPIPARYLNHETSGLTYQVKTGDQIHPVELTP